MSTVISVDNVTKEFQNLKRYGAGLKSLLLDPASVWQHVGDDRLPAVSGISFSVRAGEIFGVLGRNGAGKSTLLGLIGGMLSPTRGKVSVQGRVCPLLELGAGFSPDLTGRENIMLNGILLGMRRHEVLERSDDIIEFSGLRRVIDQTIKTYSSGMQIRLGFSIATHSNPDILLVDEVLAVGDAEFQEQCLALVGRLRSQGVTIVFVSHDLVTLESICDRAVWLDQGRLMAIGTPKEVIAEYHRDVLLGSQGSHGVTDEGDARSRVARRI